ncbi:kinase-like domain-containing protein [Abortiporus biennis]|nr:kinase-like domain-containing protein [Abortiporus biennis]
MKPITDDTKSIERRNRRKHVVLSYRAETGPFARSECRKFAIYCDGFRPCSECKRRVDSENCEQSGGDLAQEPSTVSFVGEDIPPEITSFIEPSYSFTWLCKCLVSKAIGTTAVSEDVRTAAKTSLLSLRGSEALEAIAYMEFLLDDSKTGQLSQDQRHELRYLLLRLSKNSHILPPSVFINGTTCLDTDAIAGGAFADIYSATYQSKKVALKKLRVFRGTISERDGHHEALCREALVWRQLRHENILPFFGVDRDTFGPFLCMVSPWMEYGNMMQCRAQRLTAGLSVPFHTWITDIVEGLKYLHNERVVHGDLRGANILITEDLRVQLADFGLSKFANSTTASWGSLGGGTTRWMAPELFHGLRPTFFSDIYAFGCVCLELHTGKHPFPETRLDSQVIARVLQGDRPEKPTIGFTIDPDLWDIITHCWTESPEERPDVAFLAKAIQEEDLSFVKEYDLVFTTISGSKQQIPLKSTQRSSTSSFAVVSDDITTLSSSSLSSSKGRKRSSNSASKIRRRSTVSNFDVISLSSGSLLSAPNFHSASTSLSSGQSSKRFSWFIPPPEAVDSYSADKLGLSDVSNNNIDSCSLVISDESFGEQTMQVIPESLE